MPVTWSDWFADQHNFSCMEFFKGFLVVLGRWNPNLVLFFANHIVFLRNEKQLKKKDFCTS